MACVSCQKEEGGFAFDTLQVRTLHVRDMGGEKRVQALGETGACSVCRGCAEQELRSLKGDGATYARKCLPFFAVAVAGLCAYIVFSGREQVISTFGAIWLIAGAMILFWQIYQVLRTGKMYRALPEEEALLRAAWERAKKTLPKKRGEEDLTYIPVNEETRAYPNGDLMIAFDLLPDIALQAYDRLHPEEAKAPASAEDEASGGA